MDEARFEITSDGRYKATYKGTSAVFDSYEEAALWLDQQMYPNYYSEKED